MPLATPSRTRISLGGLAGLALVLALSGCAGFVPTAQDEPVATAEQPSSAPDAPWGENDTPTVVVEFERDGETHTLSGEIPFGLQSCNQDGRVAISSTSPGPGIGVMFGYEAETPVVTSAWIVGDEFVAQMLTTTVVTETPTEDGGTNYSVIGATGRASVQARDVNKLLISDYDFGAADQVEATASFIVHCPAA